ncbi:uncharacterized protein LOC144615796 [Panthera onca]
MKRPGVGPDPAPVRHSQNRGTNSSKDHSQEDPAAGDPTGENDPGLLTRGPPLGAAWWAPRRQSLEGRGGRARAAPASVSRARAEAETTRSLASPRPGVGADSGVLPRWAGRARGRSLLSRRASLGRPLPRLALLSDAVVRSHRDPALTVGGRCGPRSGRRGAARSTAPPDRASSTHPGRDTAAWPHVEGHPRPEAEGHVTEAHGSRKAVSSGTSRVPNRCPRRQDRKCEAARSTHRPETSPPARPIRLSSDASLRARSARWVSPGDQALRVPTPCAQSPAYRLSEDEETKKHSRKLLGSTAAFEPTHQVRGEARQRGRGIRTRWVWPHCPTSTLSSAPCGRPRRSRCRHLTAGCGGRDVALTHLCCRQSHTPHK